MLLRRAFLAASTAWAAAIPLATLVASRTAGADAGYAFALVVYAIGHMVCHQLPARSFHLWGTVLPVCARCAGIYAGAAVASVVTAVARGRRLAEVRLVDRSAEREGGSTKADPRAVLLISILPTAATLIFEWTTGVTPANWIRALAGLPIGVAVAWAIGMVN